MYTNNTLQPIDNRAPYTDSEGNKYPRNFPKAEITELHLVTETPRPVDTETEKVTGFHIDETYTQVWDSISKTQEELDSDKLTARRQALAAVWSDSFALLDDILANGIDDVKTRRNAIKTAHPKP